MTDIYIIILLATGAFTGFASGLLGVGGGFIMTPVQYALLTNMGLTTDNAIRMAFGTNLAVILPTALSGIWRHNREGVVRWRPGIVMGACGAVAAFGGSSLAAHLNGEALKLAFGIIALLVGLRMLLLRESLAEEEPRNNPWLWLAWAIPVGAVTGLLGLGGGVLAVPVMVLALKFRMYQAVATSLLIIVFTSTGGIIGYIIHGLNVAGLPPHSLGYINLPAFLVLTLSTIGMAQLGAVAAHRVSERKLRYIFALLIIYIGLHMIGVFGWLGLPL